MLMAKSKEAVPHWGWTLGDITVELVDDLAQLPSQANESDFGYDLYASETKFLPPHDITLVSTGLKMQFPDGFGGKIFDRSSIATKKKIITVAGVIDPGYLGIIKIAFLNPRNDVVVIQPGEKIAQMVIMRQISSTFKEGKITNVTDRGERGFGSSDSRQSN